jgi:hypothetical protein
MRLFARGCGALQLPYTAPADELSVRDRLDLESHAAGCPECASALRDLHVVDVALRRAFAPLRERRTMLAPGRVRLALAAPRVERATWFQVPSFFGRLAEVSVMVGVTLFTINGSLPDDRTVAPEPRSVIQEYFRAQPPTDEIEYFRWLRLRPEVSTPVRDAVRLPVGGRYDVEPVEIVAPRSSPR